MILRLTYQNLLDETVLLRSNMATGQPLQPRQKLEMTFSLEPNPSDGVAELLLICEPYAAADQ